jgi:hypothetical protein
MRRALVLATLLATPALALAQVPEVAMVTLQNGRDFPMYVNGTECASGTVTAAWNPLLVNGYSAPPATGYYVMYGANQATRNVNGIPTCWTENDVGPQYPSLAAGQVTSTQGAVAPLATSAAIDTQALIAAAGWSCASEGASVWICMQGFDPDNGNTTFGIAWARVQISTLTPPPPVIASVTPGDGALNVSWDPGMIASPDWGDSYAYQLTAEMVASTATSTDPSPHVSPPVTGTSARIQGLVNGVTYAVTAKAISRAGNESDPSAAAQGTPRAAFSPASGSGGGCAAGLAGPLSLALLAGVFAIVRRRR